MNNKTSKIARICYITEETAAYLMTIVTTGAYLATLCTYMGLEDWLTGLLSSFVALGCCLQLLSVKVFGKGRVKRKVTIMFELSNLLFVLLYGLQIIENSALKTIIFVLCIFFAHGFKQLVFAAKTNWFMGHVDDNKRGIFTSIKEACSLLIGMGFTVAAGWVVDYYEAQKNYRMMFTIIGSTLFVLTVIHAIALILAKEKEPAAVDEKAPKVSIRSLLSDKAIRRIVGLKVLWSVAAYCASPFFGTYQIKELGFSMSFVTVLSIVMVFSRVPASFALGKYADKCSFAKMLRICYFAALVGYIAIVFSSPTNGHITYTAYTALYAIAMGGTNSASINLIFDYVGPDKRSHVISLSQASAGVIGFFTTLAATPIVNAIQKAGNTIFGVTVYAQQLLSGVSALIILAAIIYLSKVIMKMEPHHINT